MSYARYWKRGACPVVLSFIIIFVLTGFIPAKGMAFHTTFQRKLNKGVNGISEDIFTLPNISSMSNGIQKFASINVYSECYFSQPRSLIYKLQNVMTGWSHPFSDAPCGKQLRISNKTVVSSKLQNSI